MCGSLAHYIEKLSITDNSGNNSIIKPRVYNAFYPIKWSFEANFKHWLLFKSIPKIPSKDWIILPKNSSYNSDFNSDVDSESTGKFNSQLFWKKIVEANKDKVLNKEVLPSEGKLELKKEVLPSEGKLELKKQQLEYNLCDPLNKHNLLNTHTYFSKKLGVEDRLDLPCGLEKNK